MKTRVNLDGATYKEWIGLSAAPIFWVASIICFVLGLAFKQDTGVFIVGIPFNLTMVFSIGLGLANTAIQIVGNDTDREDMGMSLWLMWIASYMLGIGSNVNFLYSKIGLSSPILQFLVCWGLGVMIEVAPERLLVKFLRAIGVMGGAVQVKARVDTNTKSQQSQPMDNPQYMGNNNVRGVELRHDEAIKAASQTYPETSLPRVDQIPAQDVPKFLMEQQRKKNKSR